MDHVERNNKVKIERQKFNDDRKNVEIKRSYDQPYIVMPIVILYESSERGTPPNNMG